MNTPILDVMIGLALTFFLVSIVSSGINEWIAGLLSLRAKVLEKSIREFLQSDEHRARFYQHPLISLLTLEKKNGLPMPSYIPANHFARAFLDALPGTEKDKPTSIDDVKRALTNIADARVKAALEMFLRDAHDDIEKLRTQIETWYNDTMDRLSGWYKRRAQWIILLISLGVTVSFNIDSLAIAKSLWSDPVLREQWAMLAEQTVSEQTDDSRQQAMATLHQLRNDIFPIGQSPLTTLQNNGIWNTILGWLLTAGAASLGAPFWFELVNKLVNLRASGRRPPVPDKNPSP